MGLMSEIALYYPYIHVRDDNWLKAAALYWPKLARLAPPSYPRYDSDVARVLDDELDFFVNISPPAKQVEEVANEFLIFLDNHYEQLERQYFSGTYTPEVASACGPHWRNAWLEMLMENSIGSSWDIEGNVHIGAMSEVLNEELVSLGLASLAGEHDDNWLVVHPAISSAYSVTLVDRVARANDLSVVTDQPKLHETHSVGVAENFASILLGAKAEDQVQTHDNQDVATMYANIAIQTVVPANLENIPAEKIAKVRITLANEFDTFREHLNSLADDFASLVGIENTTVLQARLQMLVDRDLRRPTAALERSLRLFSLEPMKAVLGLKTLNLPAAAAAATSVAGVPVAAGQAGLVTARLVAGALRSRSQRRAAMQAGPAGYLLGLKKKLK